jgi:hypothetical protein
MLRFMNRMLRKTTPDPTTQRLSVVEDHRVDGLPAKGHQIRFFPDPDPDPWVKKDWIRNTTTKYQLTITLTMRVAYYSHQRYKKSAKLCINDAPSHRLPLSLLLGDGDSLYQRYGELTTPRIIDGEIFRKSFSRRLTEATKRRVGDSPYQ